MIILEEDVDHNIDIQFIHRVGNPRACMSLVRKDHSIVSKAFLKSIFAKIAGFPSCEMWLSSSLVILCYLASVDEGGLVTGDKVWQDTS